MSDAKTKALKVLCWDRANRRHLERNDPQALIQGLDAIGEEPKVLADWLLAFDHRILNAIMDSMEEDHDDDMILEFRGVEVDSQIGKQAISLITAAANLRDCGLQTPEAADQLWSAIVTEIQFWLSEAGMRDMVNSLC